MAAFLQLDQADEGRGPVLVNVDTIAAIEPARTTDGATRIYVQPGLSFLVTMGFGPLVALIEKIQANR